ncbi:hypothetical protein RSAG8_08812, partial [Rhizoctonia solani AG-8 WAC10335]
MPPSITRVICAHLLTIWVSAETIANVDALGQPRFDAKYESGLPCQLCLLGHSQSLCARSLPSRLPALDLSTDVINLEPKAGYLQLQKHFFSFYPRTRLAMGCWTSRPRRTWGF